MSTNAILKYKPAKAAEQTIKAVMIDDDDEEVKETIPKYVDGSPKENVIQLMHIAQNLEKTYDISTKKKTKKLVQMISRALSGSDAQDTWLEKTATLRYDANNIKEKILQAQQDFCKEYLGDDALENQMDYLETTAFPRGQSLEESAKRVFKINKLSVYFDRGVNILTTKELNRKIIAKAALKGDTRLRYHELDGDTLTTEQAILKLLRKIQREKAIKKEIEEEKPPPKRKEKAEVAADDDATPDSDRCPLHPTGTHSWAECRSNPKNKLRALKEKERLKQQQEKKTTQNKENEVNAIEGSTKTKKKTKAISWDNVTLDDESDSEPYHGDVL